MKLPNHCLLEKTSIQQFFEIGVDRSDCCRADLYLSEDEPPLCRFRETEPEVYRFFWKSSFNGDAVVHIARKGASVGLRASRSSHSRLPLSVPLASVALALDDWENLQRVLTISDFWSFDAADENFGLDGARWLIEGRRGDTYHSVERWCPRLEAALGGWSSTNQP